MLFRTPLLSEGKYAKAFEETFANYIGVKNCIGVGNGTDALYIALEDVGDF